MKITLSTRYWAAIFLGLLLPFTVSQAAGLKDFEGNPGAISNYTGNGKWLVVMIWASDCHICNHEAHQYVDFHFAHSDDDASVLGISIDGKAKKKDAEAFIKRHHVTFPNLIGEPLTVARMFYELTGSSWIGTPTFLIYDPKGELVAQQVGAVPTELIEDFIARSSRKAAQAKTIQK